MVGRQKVFVPLCLSLSARGKGTHTVGLAWEKRRRRPTNAALLPFFFSCSISRCTLDVQFVKRRSGRLHTFPPHHTPGNTPTTASNAARPGRPARPSPPLAAPLARAAGSRAVVGRRQRAARDAGRLHCVPGERVQAQRSVAVSVEVGRAAVRQTRHTVAGLGSVCLPLPTQVPPARRPPPPATPAR
jgi:hypothetical protein